VTELSSECLQNQGNQWSNSSVWNQRSEEWAWEPGSFDIQGQDMVSQLQERTHLLLLFIGWCHNTEGGGNLSHSLYWFKCLLLQKHCYWHTRNNALPDAWAPLTQSSRHLNWPSCSFTGENEWKKLKSNVICLTQIANGPIIEMKNCHQNKVTISQFMTKFEFKYFWRENS
jgi:hypothetical protein